MGACPVGASPAGDLGGLIEICGRIKPIASRAGSYRVVSLQCMVIKKVGGSRAAPGESWG